MRDDLDRKVDHLRTTVVGMGERADGMLAGALRALADEDPAAADVVIETDQLVDRAYEQVQHGVLTVVALHGPVGRDLRFLTALIHVSLHLERMGDYAVNVARTAHTAAGQDADAELTRQLVEMGGHAREVGQVALRAFVRGDVDLARTVPRLDDAVDRLNRGIFRRLVELAAEEAADVEWAARMIQLTRQLERYADHGVDVAEQTLFVVTGETLELSSNDPE